MAEEVKHAAGPWVVTKGSLGERTGQLFVREGPGVFGTHVAHVHPRGAADDGGSYLPDALAYANARLIAAAPDLLAALKAVKAFGSHSATDDGVSVSYLVESAIAKAEGATRERGNG